MPMKEAMTYNLRGYSDSHLVRLPSTGQLVSGPTLQSVLPNQLFQLWSSTTVTPVQVCSEWTTVQHP
jgi:hypothetical protein